MKRFEIVYVEKAAAEFPLTERLVRLLDLPTVTIERYGELFHRPHQSFRFQKAHPALLLAKSDGPYLYDSPQRVGTVERAFYTDQIRNCEFDCDYCFLQGMHQSGYPVIFVNDSDYHAAALAQAVDGPVRISTSFLTDALSLEHLAGSVASWIAVARRNPSVTVDIRTKSSVTLPFVDQEPLSNVRIAWTVSPDAVVGRYERGCASLTDRLQSLRAVAMAGWRPDIAFDPVLLIPGWREHYRTLIERVAAAVDRELLGDVTYGVFRMASGFLDRARSGREDSSLLYHSFARKDGLATYRDADVAAIRGHIEPLLVHAFGAERTEFVHG